MVRRLRAAGVFLLLLNGAVSLPAQSHPVKIAKEEYVRRLKAQLDDTTVKIRRLSERSAHIPPGSKAAFLLAMRRLWQKERVTRILLERIKRSKGDQWLAMKKSEDAEIISLIKSYNKVSVQYPV